MMLQRDEPDDYVIATNEMHSVREFVVAAFAFVGKSIRWEGHGLEEVGIEEDTNIIRVRVNSRFFRPTEVVRIENKSYRTRENFSHKNISK